MYRHGLRVSEAINFRSERFDQIQFPGWDQPSTSATPLPTEVTQYGVGRYPDRSHI